MNRTGLYIIIFVLAAAVLGLGVAYHNAREKTSGIHIKADNNGLTIEHTD